MYSGRSARPSIRPVRRFPRLFLTDFLTSWKTSLKLKLRSKPSDIPKPGDASIFPKTLLSTRRLGESVPRSIWLGRIFKDWISRQSIQARDPSNHISDEWSDVKRAVEEALPFYESISEAISFGLAGPLRRRAIRRLESSRWDWVLDSGSGPGVSSRMLLQDGFERVIGVDPSKPLLRSAKTRLGNNFHPIQAIAENIPLRSFSVSGAITCFSLRDVRDKTQSVSEFARVIKNDGFFEIVDVGKPDSQLLQRLVSVYVIVIMPLFARVLVGRRSKTNPFRMIIPTFRRLQTNRELARLTASYFSPVSLQEFLLGGLVVVDSRAKRKPANHFSS